MIYNAAFELIWPKRRRPQWRTWWHVNVQVRDRGAPGRAQWGRGSSRSGCSLRELGEALPKLAGGANKRLNQLSQSQSECAGRHDRDYQILV